MRSVLVVGGVVGSIVGGVFAAGCGGSRPRETTPTSSEPAAGRPELQPITAAETWYRVPAICGQGPYEVEVPVASARWGEEVELHVATPRRIALHAVIVADDAEAAKDVAVYDAAGKASGKAENTRCVADARERLVVGRPGVAGGPPGTPVETGVRVRPPDAPPVPPGPPPPVVGLVELDRGEAPPPPRAILRHGWRHPERGEPRPYRRIRIRLWSIEPNDLEGVRFGVRRIEWRPTGGDAAYEAYLARIAAEDEARRRRAEEELARRLEEEARRQREAPRRPSIEVKVDLAAERERARREREEEEARQRREEEARRRRAEEAERERLRREARLAAEAERKRRREAFCAAHPEDRGCWGAGGLRVRLQLDERERERGRYCEAHAADARCWSADERQRRAEVSRRRIAEATAPPKQPDGPPPAPVPETAPPKLSANAEWRPGYWHWTGKDWAWLAGMWRVPEADIAAEQTTTAPEAPPPPRTEPAPPPPMPAAIWVAGFWQWGGRAWVWVPGSWQARPDAGAAWRPAEWRVRGRVHVLIPGAWVSGGVRGRGR